MSTNLNKIPTNLNHLLLSIKSISIDHLVFLLREANRDS